MIEGSHDITDVNNKILNCTQIYKKSYILISNGSENELNEFQT